MTADDLVKDPPMDKIVPRWEWRTFGSEFGTADATFADLDQLSLTTRFRNSFMRLLSYFI